MVEIGVLLGAIFVVAKSSTRVEMKTALLYLKLCENRVDTCPISYLWSRKLRSNG